MGVVLTACVQFHRRGTAKPGIAVVSEVLLSQKVKRVQEVAKDSAIMMIE